MTNSVIGRLTVLDVCPTDPKIKYSVFTIYMCVLLFMYYNVFYFTGIFYEFVRQISMLFIDNKDSVFCKV